MCMGNYSKKVNTMKTSDTSDLVKKEDSDPEIG